MKKTDCGKCYTCETGIVSSVTRDMLEEGINKCGSSEIPKEWLTKSEGLESKCAKCFTCEKGYSPQPSSCGVEKQTQQKRMSVTYFLFPTNECNLRCSYCYATKQPYVMSKETRDATLHFIFEMEKARFKDKSGKPVKRDISIQFFGGEPTTQWETIKDFVLRGTDIIAKSEDTVRWGMTTNCTLLNRERLRWLRHNNFNLLLSIDGPAAIHDRHRKTKNGKGSFHMIPMNLLAEYYPNCEIRPTITPETVEAFPKTLQWFYDREFFTIATEVAYEADWTDEAMEKARVTYKILADMYVKRKNAKLPFWMKFIQDGRKSLGSTRQLGGVCGIADRTIAIDGLGFLFACQRYASFSDRSLALGTVQRGFDKAKLEKANTLKREHMQPDPNGDFFCDECPALWKCRGGCNAMNYQTVGDRKFIMQNLCKFQRLWAEMGLMALSATGELWQILDAQARKRYLKKK